MEHSIYVNVTDILFNATIDLAAIVPKDLNAIYFSNKHKLKDLLKINETELDDFLSNHHYDSLVYFGELIELQKLYTHFVKKEIEKDKQYNQEGLQDILDKLTSNPRSKVEWISENARLDQVYAEGKAGLGYDMKYVNDEGKTIYVEVKASTGEEESFYMTTNEMEFAEQQGKNFELIFVTNINDDRQRQLYRYKNLFQYEEGQSRFDNNKFRIDAKEYRLQTRKK
ncbi:hypothetical protein CVD28_06495 [Bacillus sp. M6-12]|uniref:DUF3883 domain-containing protein n=1 Tax=Bacillus sp. M6-12 TaxID=2054166 RepID=UPI000C7954E5|nr:DUF3883 domain-containing protein [Bacillus sp. M6-12]PLS18760.1 hypothetical protein CVD28_06495 [Bacillus sp. M6-12]